MKLLNLIQGSQPWLAHRATCWNASEAAMTLGVSPYLSRQELVRWRATGIAPEWSEATLRIFAEGHRCEALARPLAEKIIADELYPCVGVIEGTKYSASFDGITLDNATLFEHKLLNAELRAAFDDMLTIAPEHREVSSGRCLPEYHRIQMEQQLMVDDAGERVLFMASEWEGNTLVEERHCWYYPDLKLRARIAASWPQFDADVAAYVPEAPAAPMAVGRAPDQLPALHIELTGMVTASNLAEFKDHAIAVFQGIRTDLKTDQDFADAEKTVKWCGDIEDRLKAAKDHALSQTASIDELFRTIDAISAEARTKRLELDKLVKTRKEQIRHEIIEHYRASVVKHYESINATMGEHAIHPPQSLQLELAAAIKGKKTLGSITDAADEAAARAKIDASMRADAVRASIAALAEASAGHETLFADRVALCAAKTPEDVRNLAATRIAEHQKREEAKRAEAERVAAQKVAESTASQGNDARAAAEPPPPTPSPSGVVPPRVAGAAPMPAGARIKLGDVNARLHPISLSADGIRLLGIESVGRDKNAILYLESDFPRIASALASHCQAIAMNYGRNAA